MIYIGLDNGVTGSVGIIIDDMAIYKPTPVRKCLNYTKAKSWITRVDGPLLENFLRDFSGRPCQCLIERPMVNPGRWKATVSALRALETTQTVLEGLKIPYAFLDSKEWQKKLLPAGLEKEELKLASLQVGMRLFPKVDWKKFKDADGLLIAEYARRFYEKIFPAPAGVKE